MDLSRELDSHYFLLSPRVEKKKSGEKERREAV